MLTLGIDTSNYATSLAVINSSTKEVVCDLKRFLPVKNGELGLRQSDALFHHTQALPQLLAELSSLCGDFEKISSVGVSFRPRPVHGSYMPCFLAGVNAATAFCLAKKIPLVKCSHQEGHVASAIFASNIEALFSQELLVFHISGGTTELLLCNGTKVVEKLGESTDLYAGQAVDRIGVKLGLSFPAGAQLSQLAAKCPEKINPRVSVKATNCSLSGLENQCSKLLLEKSEEYVAKYCLAYIANTVVEMLKKAKERFRDLPIICAGGVMSSEIIKLIVQEYDNNIIFVPSKFSSDNAIGTAVIAAKEAKFND